MINRKNILQMIFFSLVIVAISIMSMMFIMNIINNHNYNPIPLTLNIFGSNIADKTKDEINKSILSNIENAYEKSIAKIDLSITLFSCALGIFTIVFGFFYFLKIRESEKLMEEIQTRTDDFFKRYYRNQYNKNVSDLFSDNNIKRANALKNISNNPEISQDDFDILKMVLLKEFDYKRNAFVYGNINSIINILASINNEKMIGILIHLLQSNNYDHVKMYQLLQYIVVDELENTKLFIKNLLRENSALSNQIVYMLIQYDVINEYSDFILENGNEKALEQLVILEGKDNWKVKVSASFLLKRKEISDNIFYLMLGSKSFSASEKAALTLHFCSTNDDLYENRISRYIDSIREDENAKTEFLDMVKKSHVKEKIVLYFKKNKCHFNYFNNIPLANEYRL